MSLEDTGLDLCCFCMFDDIRIEESFGFYYATCDACGARGSNCNTKEEAMKNWNDHE